MAARRLGGSRWRANVTDEFVADLNRAAGNDALLRERAQKKMNKILDDPERAHGGKTGALTGLKAERVDPFVIIYDFARDRANPPGVVNFRGFWHHNDRRYDP